MNTTTESMRRAAAASPGRRNRFFAHKRMGADDFTIEQDYMIARRRLVGHAVLGWGIVQGFAIAGAETAGNDCGGAAEGSATPDATAPDEAAPQPVVLTVGPGLALDRGGRELHLAAETAIDAANALLLVESAGSLVPRRLTDAAPGRYLLAVHYAERPSGGTVVAKGCCTGDVERTHVQETVHFSLRPLGSCACPCGEAGCPEGRDCRSDACVPGHRSHARLVAEATARGGAEDPAPLRRWDGIDIALCDPVDLACVELAERPDPCRPLRVTRVDASSPRRLLKRNDLLFDLVSGCDLTRIAWTSWGDWHRLGKRMDWATFAGFFTETAFGPDGRLTDFSVRFTGPVRQESLRPDVIAITVRMADGGTGWLRRRGVPIVGLDLTPAATGLPPGTTDHLRVAVARRWFNDEVKQGGESNLAERSFVVEIEVRGDLIEDCSGQPVDADAVGLLPWPSGNGTPGGTYFSAFEVSRRADESERTAS